jgi:hypothetical protein
MGIISSSDPTVWGELDGIYIDDTSPPPAVTGVAANTAIIVGQFERGATGIQGVGSTGQLFQLYGNNINFSGNQALQNKKFGLLKVIRVTAAAAVNALKVFHNAVPTGIIQFTALWTGAYGNNIQVTITAGSTVGSKYVIHDANPNAVFPDEVYDNVVITAVGATFALSNLCTVTVLSTSTEPSVVAATNLATGSDGTIADTDYLAAIGQSQVSGSGNILFLDANNTVRNAYLKTSMALTTDKMCLVCGQPGDSVGAAVTDVALNRDVDGRLIYAYPYVYTTIGGTSTVVSPTSFYASLLSQIAPNIDPAYAANAQYLSGIDALDADLQVSDYVTLWQAGISAFENDPDFGMKVKSGVVTQIADSSKIMVFRRRMADYIIQSLAKFLKNYQNAPNSLLNQTSCNTAMTLFNTLLEGEGLVPKDAEVETGKASLIDTKSLNTDDSISQGYFKIIYKRRIYSSMRFIVLQTDIGTSVVVTESEAA